uniref:Uncharacterized protein n=1 Tax=Haptolina brevifila TaxID=156173 RepID=A0A7S2DNR8_9EUKA
MLGADVLAVRRAGLPLRIRPCSASSPLSKAPYLFLPPRTFLFEAPASCFAMPFVVCTSVACPLSSVFVWPQQQQYIAMAKAAQAPASISAAAIQDRNRWGGSFSAMMDC